MSAVTRSLIFDMLKVFGTAMTVIASVLIFTDIVKELQLNDIPVTQFGRLLPFMVPFAVKTGFHGALVFATCVTYGRFAANNELLAVKSVGISPAVMVWPVLLLSLPLTIAGVWLHELDAGWGSDGIVRVLVDHADEIARKPLDKHGVVKRPEFTLVARDVAARGLYGVTLFCHSPDKGREVTITAEEAELNPSINPPGLHVRLQRGVVTGRGFRFEFPDEMEETLSMKVPATEIVDWNKVREQSRRVDDMRHLLKASGNDAADGPVWDKLREQLNLEEQKLSHDLARFHYKWANASSCFFLVLLGAPLAMIMRLSDYVTNFFVCFVPMVLIYQPLQRGPVHLAEAGVLPPYAVWFANVAVGLVGLYLMRVIVRR